MASWSWLVFRTLESARGRPQGTESKWEISGDVSKMLDIPFPIFECRNIAFTLIERARRRRRRSQSIKDVKIWRLWLFVPLPPMIEAPRSRRSSRLTQDGCLNEREGGGGGGGGRTVEGGEVACAITRSSDATAATAKKVGRRTERKRNMGHQRQRGRERERVRDPLGAH